MFIRELLRLGQYPAFYFSPDEGIGSGDVGEFGQDLADLGDDDNDKGEKDDDDQEDDDSDDRGRAKKDDDDEGADEKSDEDEEEDEEVDPKKGEKKKGKEEDEEEEEDEDEDKEEDEEKKPERIVGRPTIKQIKDAGILKTMPAIREIYFREQEFSKHFNDPEQAEEAVVKAESYDRLETSVVEGKPEVMLGELAESNPKAFKAFTSNLLPSIRQIDSNTYLAMTEPVIVEVLQLATAYAKKLGVDSQEGKNILNSARHIANFVFANGGEIPEVKKQEKHPAEIELEKEREKAAKVELTRASTDINGRIDKSLVGFLTENMPRGLSEIEREHIVEKSLDLTVAEIAKDKNFGMKMRGLWKRAQLAQFPESLKVAIINAQVARAKPLLKEFRDKLTAKALKARGGRSKEDQDDKNDKQQGPKKRSFSSNGRGGGSGRRQTVLDSRKIDYSRTTDKDILEDDGGNRVKFKGQR